MERLVVSISLTSGFHPEINGQVERANQDVGRFLQSYCQARPGSGRRTCPGPRWHRTRSATPPLTSLSLPMRTGVPAGSGTLASGSDRGSCGGRLVYARGGDMGSCSCLPSAGRDAPEDEGRSPAAPTITNKTEPTTTASNPGSPTSSSLAISPPSSISSTHNGSGASVIIIVSMSLVTLLLVVGLLIVYRWKCNKETAVSSASTVNTGINREGCDGDYEEINDQPLHSNIYANLPTCPSESQLPQGPQLPQ
uniref:Uncharacterized protein n=1 Tax=Oncorhynchus tshawytscha TaxID=74940 RepID=A0A8C8JB11_ONCTS